MSKSCRACAPARKSPEEFMNFSAFHSAGLWLAVIAMPPRAPRPRTSNCTVGTGHTSRSKTLHPDDRSPATTACRTISPDVRVSRPMTIVPGPTNVPNACVNLVSRVGVRDSPTTPLTPEMLIFSVGIARINLEVARGRERRLRRGHGIAEANFGAAQGRDARLYFVGRERGAGLVKDPVDVFRVAALALLLPHAVAYEPEVEVHGHERLGVEAVRVIRELSAVDEVFDVAVRDLRDERVPAGAAPGPGVEDVVLLPVRLGVESLPRRRVQRRPRDAPAAVGQVLEIELAVVHVPRRFER